MEVRDKIKDIEESIKFNEQQRRTLKNVHCELLEATKLLEAAKGGDYNQKVAAENQLKTLTQNLEKAGNQIYCVDTLKSAKELECILLAEAQGFTGFGGIQLNAPAGVTGDHVGLPLQCWNNVADLAVGDLQIAGDVQTNTIVTSEQTYDYDDNQVGNLTAYALVNDYLNVLEECNACITPRAINKVRVRNFQWAQIDGSTGAYQPGDSYTVQAKLIGHSGYEGTAKFVTNGSLQDFVEKWNCTFLGEAAPAELVTTTDYPYALICVKSGADLVFGLSPGEENQSVSVELVPEVEGLIQDPTAGADCITLDTAGLNLTLTLQDCPGDTTRDVYGRHQAIISGYAILYSQKEFRIEAQNQNVAPNLGTTFSTTISRDFPLVFDWCYQLAAGDKVSVPTSSTPITFKSDILVLPLGIFRRWLEDLRLCDLDDCDLEHMVETIEELYPLLILHSEVVRNNVNQLHALKCGYIEYANECLSGKKVKDFEQIYGKDKCIYLDKRFCRDKVQKCRRRCYVKCESDSKSKSKSRSRSRSRKY